MMRWGKLHSVEISKRHCPLIVVEVIVNAG
jgi:hypothetical protein